MKIPTRAAATILPMGGSGAQKPGDDPEPFLVPDTADRRHPGNDVLDGSELGLQVPALLMEPLSGILAK